MFPLPLMRVWIPLCAITACQPRAYNDPAADRNIDTMGSGGKLATASQFPSVVLLPNNCTALKIGAHQYLTAAHCVLTDGGERIDPPFDLEGEVTFKTGNRANSLLPVTVVVYKTLVFAKDWDYGGMLAGDHEAFEKAGDVAIIVVRTDTPDIPVSEVDYTAFAPNDAFTIASFGCRGQEDLNFKADLLYTGGKISEAKTLHNIVRTKQVSGALSCHALSGGPVLARTKDAAGKLKYVVRGVTSYGFPSELVAFSRMDEKNPSGAAAVIHEALELKLSETPDDRKLQLHHANCKNLPLIPSKKGMPVPFEADLIGLSSVHEKDSGKFQRIAAFPEIVLHAPGDQDEMVRGTLRSQGFDEFEVTKRALIDGDIAVVTSKLTVLSDGKLKLGVQWFLEKQQGTSTLDVQMANCSLK